jgi:hypothetical protein
VDPFAILGVDPGVSERELASAYRRQAKRWHPDRHGGGAARMAELNAAYERARRAVQQAAPAGRRLEPVVGRPAGVSRSATSIHPQPRRLPKDCGASCIRQWMDLAERRG